MKFKNVSKEIKHIKADGTWLTVKPGEVFEVNQTLGRLHLDSAFVRVEDKKSKPEPKPEKEPEESEPEEAPTEEPAPKDELDLNNDGKVDKKDSTIAGKVLAYAKRRKGKGKGKKRT